MSTKKLTLVKGELKVVDSKDPIKVAEKDGNVIERTGKIAFLTLGDKKSFKENLPDDLTVEQVEKSYKYTKEYIDSALAESVEVGEQTLKDDKSIDIINVSVPLGTTGSGTVDTRIKRSVRTTAPGGKDPIIGPALNVNVKHTSFVPTKTRFDEFKKNLRSSLV